MAEQAISKAPGWYNILRPNKKSVPIYANGDG